MNSTAAHRKRLGLTRSQELLIRAALMQGDPAQKAWREWRTCGDIENLERGTYYFMPLLYRNLCNLNLNDAEIPIIKGIYKKTWYKNQIVLNRFVELAGSFSEKGIDVMPLAGLASLIKVYRDPGLRPVNEMVLAIRPDQAQSSYTVAEEHGCVPLSGSSEKLCESGSAFFEIQEGIILEIRCHFFTHIDCREKGKVCRFQRTDMRFQNIDIAVMGPTDMLFYTLTRGSVWKATEPLAWIADAATIILENDIEWERLLHHARSTFTISALKRALVFLNEKLCISVPKRVIKKLHRMPVSKPDRLFYQIHWCSPGSTAHLHPFWENLFRHHRIPRRSVWWLGLIEMLPDYTLQRWKLKSRWLNYFLFLARGLRKVMRDFSIFSSRAK